MGREVDIAGDRCQRAQAGGVAHLEELLEFLGLAMQPVEVPDDDGVDRTRPDVVEHPPVRRSDPARVGAPVVIDVHLSDGPAASLGEGLAVGHLAVDAQLVTLGIVLDSGVHGGGAGTR